MKLLVYSPKSLGQALRRQRKLKKLNQVEAGAPLNLEQRTISNIERGAEGTHISTLFRLLAALDLEMMIVTKNQDSQQTEEGW